MKVTENGYLINEQVRDKEIRVISASGEQLGIMATKDAMEIANKEGLDLVKIAPNANPPVCKIVDYGKFKYEMERKAKEIKKNQKVIETKEIRLSPNIDTNDLRTKFGQTKRFLEKGHKVKIVLRFRGREMKYMQQNRYVLDEFITSLKDISITESPVKVEGKSFTVVLVKRNK